MRFLIITHTPHSIRKGKIYAYQPYIREMNIWLKYAGEVEIVAPTIKIPLSKVEDSYIHNKIRFTAIPEINLKSFINILKALLLAPYILFKISKACRKADHIHLRCPGNIGLLGCIVQLFFPKKIKTAKYAGNWDPDSKQPFSYRIQKAILSNSFLTKNIDVLVYGHWPNQTQNIKSFFTASYRTNERRLYGKKNYKDILNFVFIGTLAPGKRPLMALEIIKHLRDIGYKANLDYYGDGILKDKIKSYIEKYKLHNFVSLHGNTKSEEIKLVLKKAHFLVLPSKSEGWPKAVAEAMFFGVIPIVTAVSCLPYMLNYGERGVLISPNINDAVSVLDTLLKDEKKLNQKSAKALEWSQEYTLDYFEDEIRKLMNR